MKTDFINPRIFLLNCRDICRATLLQLEECAEIFSEVFYCQFIIPFPYLGFQMLLMSLVASLYVFQLSLSRRCLQIYLYCLNLLSRVAGSLATGSFSTMLKVME